MSSAEYISFANIEISPELIVRARNLSICMILQKESSVHVPEVFNPVMLTAIKFPLLHLQIISEDAEVPLFGGLLS